MNPALEYNKWLKTITCPRLGEQLRQMSEAEKQAAFGSALVFGTGGLRGLLGAGTNRLNVYTVRQATQGLGKYLNSMKTGRPISVAIAYDSRMQSTEFAQAAAEVLAASGIRVFIFRRLAPTPLLSYAVRSLGCDAGIIITASHNPAPYNGYKVYGSDGCQITLEAAARIQAEISRVDLFEGVHTLPFQTGLSEGHIAYISEELDNRFLEEVHACAVYPAVAAQVGLRVVYTPLNGTGYLPVKKMLEQIGVQNLFIVPEQSLPDGHFSTCPKPNPEERSAYKLALALAQEKRADLVLATDPDCDRVGAMVRDVQGDYQFLTGNETGVLLLHYILSGRQAQGTLPAHPVVVSTIVSTALGGLIAGRFGAAFIQTLTGFKFIGEQVGLLEKAGRAGDFVFGFEESNGCLPGAYVRDKDAVAAVMLLCEMASYYKKRGQTLLDVLDILYREYGYFRHKLLSFTFSSMEGMQEMTSIMEWFRKKRAVTFAGLRCLRTDDYLTSVSYDCLGEVSGDLTLPASNVLCFHLERDSEVILRPSGTEPKLKCYLTAKGDSMDEVEQLLDAIAQSVSQAIGMNEMNQVV
ncbi:MAG: phospho-sugar mutase [Ethanoligenens sp.]